MRRKTVIKQSKVRKYRAKLSERQNHRCCVCGVRFGDGLAYPTIEHVIPYSLLRHNTQANIVLTCWRCNNEERAWRIWREYCRRKNLRVDWHLPDELRLTASQIAPLVPAISASEIGVGVSAWRPTDHRLPGKSHRRRVARS